LAPARVQEPGGDLVPETARTEMHADPDPILLVGEDVHIVIPGAHRAELRARQISKAGQPPHGAVCALRDAPCRVVAVVEQLMFHR